MQDSAHVDYGRPTIEVLREQFIPHKFGVTEKGTIGRDHFAGSNLTDEQREEFNINQQEFSYFGQSIPK